MKPFESVFATIEKLEAEAATLEKSRLPSRRRRAAGLYQEAESLAAAAEAALDDILENTPGIPSQREIDYRVKQAIERLAPPMFTVDERPHTYPEYKVLSLGDLMLPIVMPEGFTVQTERDPRLGCTAATVSNGSLRYRLMIPSHDILLGDRRAVDMIGHRIKAACAAILTEDVYVRAELESIANSGHGTLAAAEAAAEERGPMPWPTQSL